MTLTAVLLAGGESRRMGTDKATIVFEGEPLWQRQFRVLRQLQPEEIFVSARTRREWQPLGTELILDEPPSRGPMSGITAALARMRTSHLLVLGVDMPFVTVADLRALFACATAGRGVVPAIGDRAEPLAAVYAKEAQADFVSALSETDWSLQTLVRRLADAGKIDIVELTKAQAARYRSVNEPHDVM